jgi:hypothetical protein
VAREAEGPNINPLYKVQPAPPIQMADPSKAKLPVLQKGFVVDFDTEADCVYILTKE